MDDAQARKSLGVLLVVIVGALLFGLVVRAGTSAMRIRVRDRVRLHDIALLRYALERTAAERGRYPVVQSSVCVQGDDEISRALLDARTLRDVVADPEVPGAPPRALARAHCYEYTSLDGSTYTLRYFLEARGATVVVHP